MLFPLLAVNCVTRINADADSPRRQQLVEELRCVRISFGKCGQDWSLLVSTSSCPTLANRNYSVNVVLLRAVGSPLLHVG